MRNLIVGVGVFMFSATALGKDLRASVIDPDKDRFSDVYYMQQHNTQDYGNKLTDWLDAGMGAIELDIIDRGKWENEAKGPYVSHSMNPGNKNCSNTGDTRLGHCFDDVIQWVNDNNPDYPIVILVDLKVSWDPVGAWNWDEVGMIDHWIGDYLGSHQYRFADYLNYHLLPLARQHNPQWAENPSSNVRAMTRAYDWPLVSELAGKIIVVLTGGKIGSKNENFWYGYNWVVDNKGVYPSTFMCPEGSSVNHVKVGGKLDGLTSVGSQRFICNNMGQSKHYQNVANEVANNNQMMHIWGNSPVHSETFEYNHIAIAHGVQFINRQKDYPSQLELWGGAIPFVGVRRSLPGFFSIKNKSNGLCLDVEGANYKNGTRVVSYPCTNLNNQQFVYTAESQLRPKGNSKYCLDIKGGKAGNAKDVHIWNCDGGTSERWSSKYNGSFTNWHSNSGGDWGNGYCLDSKGGGSMTPYHIYSCMGYNSNTRFELIPQPMWTDTHQ